MTVAPFPPVFIIRLFRPFCVKQKIIIPKTTRITCLDEDRLSIPKRDATDTNSECAVQMQ